MKLCISVPSFLLRKFLPLKKKVQAVQDAAPPASVPELQSFLESANFFRKFVPDFVRVAAPLYKLLRKESMEMGISRTGCFCEH